MQIEPVHIYQIGVTFDGISKAITFSGDMPEDQMRTVPQGVHLIAFTLNTTNGDGQLAEFPINPVQWMTTNGGPSTADQTQVFQVQWIQPYHFVIVDYNANTTLPDGNSHGFRIFVNFGTLPYYTDPTIINQPPIE